MYSNVFNFHKHEFSTLCPYIDSNIEIPKWGFFYSAVSIVLHYCFQMKKNIHYATFLLLNFTTTITFLNFPSVVIFFLEKSKSFYNAKPLYCSNNRYQHFTVTIINQIYQNTISSSPCETPWKNHDGKTRREYL